MDEVLPDRAARRAAVIAAARQRAGNDRSKAEEAELRRRAAVARRQENINYWGSPTQEHTHMICQTVIRVGQDYADQGSPVLIRFTSSASDPPHCDLNSTAAVISTCRWANTVSSWMPCEAA